MTRKDFELIAKTLHSIKPDERLHIERGRQWTLTVNAFSEMLAAQNARFKLGVFERACDNGLT